MRIVLGKVGDSKTVGFAVNEFSRYLKKIDRTLTVDERTYPAYDENAQKVIFIGLLDEKISERDRVTVKVKDGAGYITGSNERSVLFAVYKTLEALGCKWVRPSVDGEFIPEKKLAVSDFNFELDHTPSYHHRGICIEGSNKYENVYDMIDWMPKVGLNEYFMQFHVPFAFFDRWYRRWCVEELHTGEAITKEDAFYMTARLDEEIKLRGMGYHKGGHGWTYPLVGELGAGWFKYDKPVPADVQAMFAEVNGKRELWNGSLFDTNLCYSDPAVRKRFLGGIVNYCKENPAVDRLHFWLADVKNNQCECENCKKNRPSDNYVLMLNELDEMLTAEGLDTKIVFLLYFDLLWAPEKEKIKNPDRFTLMFAPITRGYKEAYADAMGDEAECDPFVYNDVTLPKEVNKNVAYLRAWQKIFAGDSFVFDYHLMWDIAADPGCYRLARVMHDDMKNLDKLGLDGMVSCQLQRVSSPTCLHMYSMARALWDKTSDFESVAKDYFNISFDLDADDVRMALKKLSELNDSQSPDKNELIISEICKILPLVKANYDFETTENYHMSWAYLLCTLELWLLIAKGRICFDAGDTEGAQKMYEECRAYIIEHEAEVQRGFDGYQYVHDMLKAKRLGLIRKS